jgi:ParB-like chromosome segregation protein Spo0J
MAKSNTKTPETQPISNVRWRHRDTLKANDYNPNRVAPAELQLLAISILEDGWTQPLVVLGDAIVDGFHRWTVSGWPAIYAMTGGMVPCVEIAKKGRAALQMATIRHNRARGTHVVLDMSKIVQEMIEKEKLPMEEICERLQMETEEVVRLAARQGIPLTGIVRRSDYSREWVPSEK